ncbi:hypothetical protein BVX98_00345 [bacterium F11]|nr:hypothetical protein BVX98_00345 [bacterium F11]
MAISALVYQVILISNRGDPKFPERGISHPPAVQQADEQAQKIKKTPKFLKFAGEWHLGDGSERQKVRENMKGG